MVRDDPPEERQNRPVSHPYMTIWSSSLRQVFPSKGAERDVIVPALMTNLVSAKGPLVWIKTPKERLEEGIEPQDLLLVLQPSWRDPRMAHVLWDDVLLLRGKLGTRTDLRQLRSPIDILNMVT